MIGHLASLTPPTHDRGRLATHTQAWMLLVTSLTSEMRLPAFGSASFSRKMAARIEPAAVKTGGQHRTHIRRCGYNFRVGTTELKRRSEFENVKLIFNPGTDFPWH